MSLLEAATAGTPIVTTSTCEIPLVFKHRHDALLFPPDRVDLARKHVEWVLTNPDEAAKMGTAARETVLKFFNPDNFVSKWNKIFESASR
jgi:glycosyltransferase involved in cell wall biosynthesis